MWERSPSRECVKIHLRVSSSPLEDSSNETKISKNHNHERFVEKSTGVENYAKTSAGSIPYQEMC